MSPKEPQHKQPLLARNGGRTDSSKAKEILKEKEAAKETKPKKIDIDSAKEKEATKAAKPKKIDIDSPKEKEAAKAAKPKKTDIDTPKEKESAKAGKTKKIDIDSPEVLINRELSWLSFARRVLALAENSELPLLERVKFAGIMGMLYDEFAMKRMGGLKRKIEKRKKKKKRNCLPTASVQQRNYRPVGKN